jgi:TolA-binding protein
MLLSVTVASAQNTDSSSHLARGLELIRMGQWHAAEHELGKVRIAELSEIERVEIEYRMAECAAMLRKDDAVQALVAFRVKYPESVYDRDAALLLGDVMYDIGDYADAAEAYSSVDYSKSDSDRRSESNFKHGYSLFMTGRNGEAAQMFDMVSGGKYAEHALYYKSYIDYTSGRYGEAERGFRELESSAAYKPIVPFYLLQIEFLKGNYDYVTAHGDELLAASDGARAADMARILSESWFHKENYPAALKYMERYVALGGRMGRGEKYVAGYSAYMTNNIGEAIRLLSEATGPDDELSQNAAYHLAGCYLRTGDKRAAMQSFSIAASSGHVPQIREDAMFNCGKLQFELGGGVFNEAINMLSKYIREYPDSPHIGEAWEYLAAAYYNSRNYDAAYEAIRMIPSPDNNIRTAYQKIAYFRALEYIGEGRNSQAMSALNEALDNRFNAKYTALAQFWKAELLFREGRYADAAALYKTYVSLSPAGEREHRLAQYNLGYCYFNTEDWSESASWFDKMLKNSSTRDMYAADALNRRGDIYFAGRKFADAIDCYGKAAASSTDARYYAAFKRAMMYGYAGTPDRKIEALTAINEGAYADDALYELGRAYMAKERYRDAATTLKRFTERYPESELYNAALSGLGLAYQNLGDNNAALGYYKRIVESAPSSPEARDAMLAIKSIYVGAGDADAYFAFASKSGIDSDMGAAARDSLAYAAAENIYLSQTSGDKRIAALQGYLDKYPRGGFRPNALYNLADASLAEGNTDESIRALTELAGMYHNGFTVRGLDKLSAQLASEKRYGEAADAFLRLAESATAPATVSKAWRGYLDNSVAAKDATRLTAAIDKTLAASGADKETKRQAKFLKAEALHNSGTEGYMPIYRELAADMKSETGAKSQLRLIEIEYGAGRTDAVEKLVMEFSASGTPYMYSLGRAFLILGDIYADKGDVFQARATYQSIVDGYSPRNDGIVDEAKRRIENLKIE